MTPRPGDFVEHEDGWLAARSLGPGDVQAIEGFEPAPSPADKEG
jgi:hypothetical protein